MRTIRATVRGMVQGVGYRYFALRRAQALGLAGTVRNLPDGQAVEVVAQGAPADVAEYLAELRRGPLGSRVDNVEVEDLVGWQTMFDFRILS